MECASCVAEALFSSAELAKVLGCLRDNISAEFKSDASDVFASNFHVEKDL
jgi:hypothetical protein